MKHFFALFSFLTISFTFLNAQPGTWNRSSNGLPDSTFYAICKNGNTLYTGGIKTGIYKSVDNAATWTPMTGPANLQNAQVWSIVALDTFVFAGCRGGGVFRSSINSNQFITCNTGLASGIVQDLVVVGNDIYAGTLFGMFVTSDFASSWTRVPTVGMNDTAVYSMVANSNYIFAGTAGNNSSATLGVAFRKPIAGGPWEQIINGLTLNGPHLETTIAMEADDNYVFSGHDDVGIHRTTNNGLNWVQTLPAPGDVYAIKICGNAGNIEVGTLWGGLWNSTDNGVNWLQDNSGFTYGAMSMPMIVRDFYLDANTLYAASDLGVFKRTINVGTFGLNDETENGIRIYPNPSSDWINIQSDEKNGSVIEVSIFNAIGQKLLSSNQFFIQVTQLAPGTYYVHIKTETGNLVKKLIKQ
jgi:hypothetical protein